jgi:hypothetical protein
LSVSRWKASHPVCDVGRPAREAYG